MLTVREAAEKIDAGSSTVRKWAVQGLFPGAEFVANSIVPHWLIPESALVGFVKPTQGRKPGAKKKAQSN